MKGGGGEVVISLGLLAVLWIPDPDPVNTTLFSLV
jgi:hypothetical protein